MTPLASDSRLQAPGVKHSPLPFTALIVEDDPSWQAILTELLTDAGLEVETVGGLQAAQGLINKKMHRLAIVDLSLKDNDANNQDGLQVLHDLQEHDPGCIKILLTGFATVELAVNALTQYKAHTCLRKEMFQRSQFLDLIRDLLAAPPYLAEMPAGDQIESPGGAETQPNASAATALVVEDDAGWRSILSELLEDAGYKVRQCSGYGDALGCLRREKYALAVIDLSLQGWNSERNRSEALDGYRLLGATKSAAIPTIVVSGVGARHEIEQAYQEQDIFAYLEKQTFDRDHFIQTVQEARPHQINDLEGLTEREREVLRLLAKGLTNKEIARTLTITSNTVKRHLKSIFEKLGTHTRAAAAARALTGGLAEE